MKTKMFRRGDVDRSWLLIDANGQVLGRLAAAVAARLRGKHSPLFTPHDDVGDNVIIVNAEKIGITGRKADQKYYHTHSGYFGGSKTIRYAERLAKSPELVIQTAVRGMLPKNRLGRKLIRKLHVYKGPQHPHEAQLPQTWTP